MKRMINLLLLCATTLLMPLAQADTTPPDVLVKNTANDVLAIIKSDKDIQAGDMSKITALAEEKILPQFDFERMSRMVLGKYWAGATPDQQKLFIEQFRTLLIRTYALIAVFRTQGYVNFILGLVGLGPFEMLYNNFAVVFGLVYVYMPFMVLPLYATIERLDRSYLEASLDLGGSQFQTFLRVTVPLTMPGIVSGIILVFIPRSLG